MAADWKSEKGWSSSPPPGFSVALPPVDPYEDAEYMKARWREIRVTISSLGIWAIILMGLGDLLF